MPIFPRKKYCRAIKLFIFFSILSIFYASAISETYSQVTKISLNLQGVTVEKALDEIKKQSDFSFWYRTEEVNLNKKVSLQVNNQTINTVLDKLLLDQNLSYKIDNKHIVIYNKATSSPNDIRQQSEIKVTGIVTDEMGETLPGANIKIKGIAIGVVSNIDGYYSIHVPQKDAVLIFSFIGYVTQEIKVGNKTEINISLKEDVHLIDEVVVVGYGTQKKVNLTGSVSTVSANRLENRPIPNVSAGLQGVVPGVTVTKNNGAPGSGASISIRGKTSLNSGGALIIIDGVPGSMDNVSPDDIETISVLKDAASSAIYGARAAEGVILITTKKGKAGEKLRIQYSNNISFQKPTRLPSPNSSYDGAVYANLSFTNAGGNPLYPEWMLKDFLDPTKTAVERADKTEWDYVADFNWWDYFLKKSFQQTHNLSLSGGSERNQFMLSASWLDQDGFFSKWGPDNFDRITFRVNMTNQLIPKKLILETNLSLLNADTDVSSLGNNYLLSTILTAGNSQPLYNPDGTFARYRMQQNTMQLLKEGGFDTNKANRFEGRTSLTWNVVDGLSVKALGGYNTSWSRRTIWKRAYYKYRPSGPSNFGHMNQPNNIEESAGFYKYYIGQFQANYDKSFGKHTIGLLAGTSVEESFQNTLTTSRSNVLGNELPALNIGEAATAKNDYTVSNDWGLVSGFARINYSYEDKYLLEANLRADGSSRFSEKHKWGYFPSFSAAWRITQEAFMQEQKLFSNLKLRASYGELGNQNGLGLYDHIASYTVSAQLIPFPGGNAQQIWSGSLPSQDRTWETVVTYNVGLDMAFLNNRLQIEADYYEKKNKNMLVNIQIPSIIGIGVPTNNYGELQTKGWEFVARWNDVIESINLKYNIGFNIHDQKDELTKLTGSFSKPTEGVQNIVGYPINSMFAYQANGYFESAEEVKGWAFQNAQTGVGDIRYVDQNDDKKITVDDVVFAGSTTPRYVFGFNFGGEWRGIDFSAFFQGVGKRDEYLTTDLTHPYKNAWDNYSFKEVMDYWTPENKNARFPRPHQGSHSYLYSTHWLQDASYIRLKNMQVGYSFPKDVLQKIKLSSLRVYLSGENLFEYTKLIMVDPETNGSFLYPLNRSYSLGLSVTF